MEQYRELCTMGDLLVRGAVLCPEREAVVLSGARRTYRELFDRATRTARSLASLGVREGDRVGVMMPNCMEFLDVLFGSVSLGAVPVAINARFAATELRYVVEDADVRVLFAREGIVPEASYAALLHETFPELQQSAAVTDGVPIRIRAAGVPTLESVVLMGARGGAGLLDEQTFDAIAEETPAAEVDQRRSRVALRDVAMMFYTSGTTANPKGCPISHEALVRTGVMTCARFGYEDGVRLFDPLPMFHTASTQPMIATMNALGTFIAMSHFDGDEGLATIEREQATAIFTAFPAITEGLLNSANYRPSSLSRVRTLFNVAPPHALRSMQERMPNTVLVNAYGMTEYGGSVTMVRPDEDLDARVTQGRPLPGIEVEIRDEDNHALPGGDQGEIVVRGPSMFEGYHKDTEKTAELIEAAGWFHTGDLGWIDSESRLHFVGRIKDMLKVGGENVGAVEIESHLQSHPAVSIAQVIAMPDEKYGEVPAAFVELRPGSSATEDEILAHCAENIAKFKVPHYVRFVTQWPMSSTKVQKSKLRDQLEAELGAAPLPTSSRQA